MPTKIRGTEDTERSSRTVARGLNKTTPSDTPVRRDPTRPDVVEAERARQRAERADHRRRAEPSIGSTRPGSRR